MSEVVQVRLSDIASWRCASPAAARQYAARLQSGEVLPPIDLIRQAGRYRYRIFDGMHRARAAKLAGRKTIRAVLIATDASDARRRRHTEAREPHADE